ncbi:MAG: hypothetical protein LDL22_10450 [Hyphomicrobiales bacterium]|nr:hypothetical protein [Hyphomicrobiales bacterium]
MRLFRAVLILSAALALAPAAEAAQGRNAALLGGLAVGAAGAAILLNNRPARAAPVVEEEVYVRPAPRYVPTCRMERRRVWIDSESYTYRRVEVCE